MIYSLFLDLELKRVKTSGVKKKEEIQTGKPIFSLNKASYCLFNKVKPFHK